MTKKNICQVLAVAAVLCQLSTLAVCQPSIYGIACVLFYTCVPANLVR